MAKKRTKAQRSAAAKKSWQLRKLQSADAPTPTPTPTPPVVGLASDKPMVYVREPRVVYAVREGDNVFACFGHGGSLNRECLDDAGARKLLRDLSAILI